MVYVCVYVVKEILGRVKLYLGNWKFACVLENLGDYRGLLFEKVCMCLLAITTLVMYSPIFVEDVVL